MSTWDEIKGLVDDADYRADQAASRAAILQINLDQVNLQLATLQSVIADKDNKLASLEDRIDNQVLQITQLGAERDRLVAEVARLNDLLKPKTVVRGIALQDQVPTNYSAFRTKHPEVTAQRIYHTPSQMPATYQTSLAKHLVDKDKAFVSFKPAIADMIAGRSSAWAKNFASSCPTGTLFCCQHEPEQKTKGISPTDFTAAINRLYGDMGKTLALRTICLMEYQFRAQGSAYMSGISSSVVDVVSADFYTMSGESKTVQQLCEPFFNEARRLFPSAKLAIGELGISKTAKVTDRAQWLKDGLVWLDANGIETYYYNTTIGGDDWTLTDAEFSRAYSGR